LTLAFKKLTQAGIGYMASGSTRKPGPSADVRNGAIHEELKGLLGFRD